MPRVVQRNKTPAKKTIEVSPYKRTYTLTEKVCPVCGKTFTGTPKARYDTVACRQKANYHRHSTDYLETRRAKYQAEKKAAGKK
jgi:rRNA maturation protein Nop10